MSFPRPTLSALRELARNEVAARLPGADPALRRSAIMVLAETLAGLAHHQYGYLDFIARQVIPDTAEGEYLDRWCRMVGLQRKPATAAAGSVTFPAGRRHRGRARSRRAGARRPLRCRRAALTFARGQRAPRQPHQQEHVAWPSMCA